MDQRARDVSFLDWGAQLLSLSSAHAVDEIGEMIVAGMAARTGLAITTEPALIAEGVFVARGEIAIRSVKDRADGVVAIEHTASDAGFVVRDPMTHFELHHFAAAAGLVEFEDAVERVRRFLVVIEHEVAADRGDAVGERDTESPACGIHLMDPLIAEVPVSRLPDPVP